MRWLLVMAILDFLIKKCFILKLIWNLFYTLLLDFDIFLAYLAYLTHSLLYAKFPHIKACGMVFQYCAAQGVNMLYSLSDSRALHDLPYCCWRDCRIHGGVMVSDFSGAESCTANICRQVIRSEWRGFRRLCSGSLLACMAPSSAMGRHCAAAGGAVHGVFIGG